MRGHALEGERAEAEDAWILDRRLPAGRGRAALGPRGVAEAASASLRLPPRRKRAEAGAIDALRIDIQKVGDCNSALSSLFIRNSSLK